MVEEEDVVDVHTNKNEESSNPSTNDVVSDEDESRILVS